TDLYTPALRAIAKEVDPSLDEGVYMQFSGPTYETPAEVQMARTIGAHLVGMSTALEAIAAREAGLDVLGISLVTNLAAGISGEALSHEEVLEAGREAGPRISRLLAETVRRITAAAADGAGAPAGADGGAACAPTPLLLPAATTTGRPPAR